MQRLNAQMAPGKKRSEAKAQAHARGESLFAFTDHLMHAHETRHNYQKIVMRFLTWCADSQNVRNHEQIDARADELVSLYLTERVTANYSAWTLQTERSALRMYFKDRDLASQVPLPKRKRKNIKRSRLPAKRDKNINLEHWQHVIKFCLASGLRREELRDLLVRDVYHRPSDGALVVRVRRGKGGKYREIPVIPARQNDVLSQTTGRDPEAHVFDRVSSNLDIHSYRRQYAQDMYQYFAGRPLPPQDGRLKPGDFDAAAALKVSRLLGHNRLDVMFGYYVR